jgi:hypothetical protein
MDDLKKDYEKSLLFAVLLVIGNIENEETVDATSLEAFIEAFRDLAKSGTA